MRDGAGRWREVIKELKIGYELSIGDAIAMLHWPDDRLGSRAPELFVGLAALAIEAKLQDALHSAPFIVLADGRRITPRGAKARGLMLVTDPEGESLGHRLGVVCPIATAFAAEDKQADAVRQYLESAAGLRAQPADEDALGALAERDVEYPIRLDDRGLRLLRDALEATEISQDFRRRIGRRIHVDGIEYVDGRRREISVSPAEAYLPSSLDTSPRSWARAAARTAGLRWVHPRYATALVRPREQGQADQEANEQQGERRLGPRSLFRELGAETAPRLRKRRQNLALRYKSATKADFSELALEQQQALGPETAFNDPGQKTGLTEDYDSPDLEAVCDDIERADLAEARSRATSLIGALNGSWDRLYQRRTLARAVHAYNTLSPIGEVPATWRARAAQTRWMTNAADQRRAPRELAIRTPAFLAMVGDVEQLYAYELDASYATTAAIRGLGFESEPHASTLLVRLVELREAETDTETETETDMFSDPDAVAKVYAALNAIAPSGGAKRAGGRNRRPHPDRAEETFRRGRWGEQRTRTRGGRALAPTLVGIHRESHFWLLCGLRLRALWTTVARARDGRRPGVEDCAAVLHRVAEAASGSREQDLLSEVYRYLIELLSDPDVEHGDLGLSEIELWTPQGWTSKRPIYAVGDPELRKHIAKRCSIWSPPIRLDMLEPLIEPLASS